MSWAKSRVTPRISGLVCNFKIFCSAAYCFSLLFPHTDCCSFKEAFKSWLEIPPPNHLVLPAKQIPTRRLKRLQASRRGSLKNIQIEGCTTRPPQVTSL